MEKPVCIYHANCVDGMGAAWAVWNYYQGDVDLFPMNYGTPPPELKGRHIFVVDFSFPKAVLEELGKENHVVIVLDHHKTAMQDLDSFPVPPSLRMFNFIVDGGSQFPEAVYALFDMERSGAGITWDYFFPGQPRPNLLNSIEDRDLWRFKLPDTREIHATLASYPVGDFKIFNTLVTQADVEEGRVDLAIQGEAIDRRHLQMINDTIMAGKRSILLAGYIVPCCNAPFAFASDMGNILCKGQPFAATYFDLGGGTRQFSLRSTDEGVDVGAIAKSYGGGGHRNAAGFTRPGNWFGDDA